jgi:hypothetical protein
MIYYIEITKPDGEKVAGEMDSAHEMTPMELITEVMEFAASENVCPSWAVSNTKYKIKEGINKTL